MEPREPVLTTLSLKQPDKVPKEAGFTPAVFEVFKSRTQTTTPFGTPEEVKQVVKERIETMGKGGGLVLAPTQVLESDVPRENVLALF